MRPALLASVLTGLLIVSTVGAAEAEDGAVVSRLADPKIVEASALAVSSKFPDLAYTLNDSKNKPIIYAVQISTGQTVGRANIGSFGPEDTESLYVDPAGQMWVGDLGDNDGQRKDASILKFPEPGPGDHKITAAERYGIKYSDGKANVEAMLVDPATSRVFLASKDTFGRPAALYALSTLQSGVRNIATNLNVQIPAGVSDGTFSPDGRFALLRTYTGVWITEPGTWNPVHQMSVPGPTKSESIALEPGAQTFLVGGEGANSPLVRWSLPPSLLPGATPTPAPTSVPPLTAAPAPAADAARAAEAPSGLPAAPPDPTFELSSKTIAGTGIGLAALLAIGAIVLRRRT